MKLSGVRGYFGLHRSCGLEASHRLSSAGVIVLVGSRGLRKQGWLAPGDPLRLLLIALFVSQALVIFSAGASVRRKELWLRVELWLARRASDFIFVSTFSPLHHPPRQLRQISHAAAPGPSAIPLSPLFYCGGHCPYHRQPVDSETPVVFNAGAKSCTGRRGGYEKSSGWRACHREPRISSSSRSALFLRQQEPVVHQVGRGGSRRQGWVVRTH